MGGSKKSSKAVQQAGTAGKPADTKEKPRQTCLHSQLHKTKFCLYHLKGACQFGANCSFAHSCAELQATPDLRKTRLCANFFEGGGCTDAECTFAHSEDDLRSTDMFYKKTLCIWNEKGKCRNGDQCRFAHGLGELRLNQKPVEQISVAPQEKRREAEKSGTRAVRAAEKSESVKEVKAEKDALNVDGDMGRQVSDTSQVTTASGGSNGSTTGSLSGNDGSTTTYSTTTRRARARGKRGGGAASTAKTQVQDSSSSSGTGSGTGDAPQPMKVLLNRNLCPADAPQPAQPAPENMAAALTASSLSLLNGTYDPLLEVELRKLRASVNALAMQCNHINQQINAEAIMSQAALQQQLLQLTQARQEEVAAQASWLARTGGNANAGLVNLNALLSAAGLSGCQ